MELRTQAHSALVLHVPPLLGHSSQNVESWTHCWRCDKRVQWRLHFAAPVLNLAKAPAVSPIFGLVPLVQMSNSEMANSVLVYLHWSCWHETPFEWALGTPGVCSHTLRTTGIERSQVSSGPYSSPSSTTLLHTALAKYLFRFCLDASSSCE